MNRRGFMGSIMALAAAPAIVRADNLMKIVVPQALRSSLDVSLFWLTSGDLYMHSMWIKNAAGIWENRIDYIEAAEETARVRIGLPGPFAKVYDHRLTRVLGKSIDMHVGTMMTVNNGCLVHDPEDTPYLPRKYA